MARTTYSIPADSLAASIMAELSIPQPTNNVTRTFAPKSLFGWYLASSDASTGNPFLTLVPGDVAGSFKGAYVAIRPTDQGLFEVPDTAKSGGIHNAAEVLESVKADGTILNTFVRAVAEGTGVLDTDAAKDADAKRAILLGIANHTLITRLGDGGVFLVWDRAIVKS